MQFLRFILFPLTVLLISGSFALPALAQEASQNEESRNLVHPYDEATFPFLLVGGNANAFTRQEAAGGFLSGDLSVDADWFLGGLRGSLGVIGNSSDEYLFTEISAYAHLLAIGVSDFTYRHYTDGHELRAFGGFSYTNHVEDVIRVDVNLGLAYFDESQLGTHLDQVGFQVGARILARFWRIRNQFYISAYQTVKFNDATIDLAGTEIVCETEGVLAGADLVCSVPESDGEGSGGGSILDWQSTGLILHNRMFLWLHQENDLEWGPELEIRVEILPLRGTQIWTMLGFRAQWDGL